MSQLLDFNGAMLFPIAGFIGAFALCYILRRKGWVWPPRLILMALLVLGIVWTVEGFQAEDDDWSGIGMIILVLFLVAPTWLGALVGADLGRRHHAKANPDLVSPR